MSNAAALATATDDPIQLPLTFNDEVIFDLDDIYAVDAAILAILALDAPAETLEVPADSPGMKGLPPSALADLVAKTKTDVRTWDVIKKEMTTLAADLSGFCGDSVVALQEMVDISAKIQRDFEKLTDRQKRDIQRDLQSMFDDLYGKTVSSERRAQNMADRLRDFGGLLGQDSAATADLRKNYQAYIDSREEEIRKFEKEKGLEPSADLLATLKKRIEQLNEEIEEKRKAWIASTSVASAMGAASLNPVFWLFSIPGVIAASIAAGVMKNQWNDRLEELKPFMEQLAKAEKVNTIKIWFEGQSETMTKLIGWLDTARTHVSNLRGQWQTLRNQLEQLTGDTGKLQNLPKDQWLVPISRFRERTIERVYVNVQRQTLVFQKLAFSEANVTNTKILRAV